MAKSNKNLAKSKIIGGCRPGYLAHFHGTLKKGTDYPVHKHEFWQMELITSGKLEIVLSEGPVPFEKGEFLIIPSGLPHGFRYAEDTDVTSVRFFLPESKGLEGTFVAGTDGAAPLVFASATASTASPSLSTEERILLENIIRAALDIHLLHLSMNGDGEMQQHVRKAEEFIASEPGRRLTVSEIAEAVGCAPPYLSSLFRKHTGVSLKKRVDAIKMEQVGRFLLYSDLSVSEIAGRAGFPDIYSFSRFVKRESGKSPRSFRETSRFIDSAAAQASLASGSILLHR